MSSALEILQQHWKHPSFRPLQREIIDVVMNEQDTFALLPTGGGKSICFQIPAILKEGICIVISPLIALMHDQVRNLQEKGIKAIALTSGIQYSELDTLLDNCIYGNYKFLYLSPERLQQDIVKERLKRMNVNLIAIDEAHCISQWGNDFRPSYKKIAILRELKPTVSIIALTASAIPEVVDDIITELDLFQPKIFRNSFYRDNLSYIVQHTLDKNHQLLEILKKHPGSSIIYVRNRKLTVEISEFLSANGHLATYYHGGVTTQEKTIRFKQWMQEDNRIIVATNAFGMGIDKANVKTVIHLNIPESIESYFQEAGRAGRDGKKAYAIILKNKNDITRVKNQFIKVLPDSNMVKLVYRKLCNYFQISYGEGQQSIHDFNFNTFCKTYNLSSLITYNALLILDRCAVINFTQRFHKKSSVLILVTGNQLLDFLENNTQYTLPIKAILRTYGGIFDEKTTINIALIASKINTTENNVIQVLEKLASKQLLEFEHSISDAEIIFLVPREDDHTIHKIALDIKKQNTTKIKKVIAMIDYVSNTSICRNKQLLAYFGEKDAKKCNHCDVCISDKTAIVDSSQLQEKIVLLLQDKQLSSREIISQLSYPDEIVLPIIKKLNEHNIIKIHQNNKYQLV